MKNFGKRLKEARAAANLTGWQVEKLSGYPGFRTSVSAVEMGRRPSDEFIERLAAITELNLNADTMLSWRIIDDYPEEAVEKAFHLLFQEGRFQKIYRAKSAENEN